MTCLRCRKPKSAGLTLNSVVPDPAQRVTGDRERIRQVLVNLASNAVKYNKPTAKCGWNWNRCPKRHWCA